MEQEIISSTKNPSVKTLRKLIGSAKYRREQGLAVAEGTHLLASLLQAGVRPEQIIYAQSAASNQEVSSLLGRDELSEVGRLLLKDSLFESLSSIHSSVGIMVLFRPPIQSAVSLEGSALLLEDVQDPGNMGTILRTAAAAGLSQVYLSASSASPWSPKSLRAGMGAQFSLDIHEDVDLVELASKSTVPVLATDLASDQSLYEAELARQVAWAFGSEGQGVSQQLLDACAQTVKIPQVDSAVESLNVSAAVAVCLFEQYRQQNNRLGA